MFKCQNNFDNENVELNAQEVSDAENTQAFEEVTEEKPKKFDWKKEVKEWVVTAMHGNLRNHFDIYYSLYRILGSVCQVRVAALLV